MSLHFSGIEYLLFLCLTLPYGIHANYLSMLISSHDRRIPHYYKIGTSFDLRNKADVSSHRYQRDTHNEMANEKPDVKSLSINSKISSRFAVTTMVSEVVNPSAENRDAYFTVQIPEVAFISNFTMVIDGVLHQAEVKEKDEAKQLYEEAKDKNKTAGLVASKKERTPEVQRGMEIFSVSITVKGNSSVHFELAYQELLIRKLGAYEHRISIRPNQVIESLTAKISVYEPQGFAFLDVYEPSLDTNSVTNVFTKITSVSDKSKLIYYEPDIEGQLDFSSDHGISGDLVVNYDVKHPYDPGLTLYQDEYFVHYFSPDENQLTVLEKNIIFVIDISGSMGGQKIRQTRQALLTILDQLHIGDKFMLLLFDDAVEYWPSHTGKELIAVNKESVKSAQEFVKERVVADGGTNINEALVTSSRILADVGKIGANMIIFLTDGQPTVGVTDSTRIVENVVTATQRGQVSIFSLAFGMSLDYELLETLSYRTQGLVKKIYIDSDVAKQLENFYNEISSPLLTNLKLIFPPTVVNTLDLTRNEFYQYFKGTEVIVAGKMMPTAPTNWDIEITADDFAMQKVIDTSVNTDNEDQTTLEKLYTYMMIKDLLRQVLLTDNFQEKETINQRALNLSLQYNLVTPLTSMVIVQSDQSNEYDRESMQNAFPGHGSIPTANSADIYKFSHASFTSARSFTTVVLSVIICLYLRCI